MQIKWRKSFGNILKTCPFSNNTTNKHMQLQLEIDLELFTIFLRQKSFLNPQEEILSVEKPGEGNMNVVLRVNTNERSFIVKQSRPYVQKYQDIPAPIERISIENQFYQIINETDARIRFPKLLGFYPEHHMMLLENLSGSHDMTDVYQKRSISEVHLAQLFTAAKEIHQSPVDTQYPSNIELRKLNHQHIFVLPFLEDNGFSLDTVQHGLQELAIAIKADRTLKEKVNDLGKLYLSTGKVLLHGDYYPGSWMLKDDQVFVIDPEFSYLGLPEFDLGVMIAHFYMATGDRQCMDNITNGYGEPLDLQLVKAFAGTEVIRRLVGLAQLPLERTLEEKRQMLDLAISWLKF